MAEVPANPASAAAAPSGPSPVRVEVRAGPGRSAVHDVSEAGFLIGSVPGCDLRLPGANLPPVLCLVARAGANVMLRKLAPVQPVLVNGKSVSGARLVHGDRVSVGPVELLFHIEDIPVAAPEDTRLRTDLVERSRLLEIQQHQLDEQTRELETDRVIWYRRREEIAEECRKQTEALEALRQTLHERETELTAASLELERQAEEIERRTAAQRDLEARTATLTRERQDLEAVRLELTTIREQLYHRYRGRRDRLAALQEAVTKAARKVQEQKRELTAETARLAEIRTEVDARAAAIEEPLRELAQARQTLAEERQRLDALQQEREGEWAARNAESDVRAQRLVEERQALDRDQMQYRADLVRLDRREAVLEEQQKQLQQRAREVDQQLARIERDSRDLEEQAQRLDEWHSQLTADAERITVEDAALAPRKQELDERAAVLEGQQTMLATLRSRLERMRDEVRRETQLLTQQRERQEAAELDLQERLQEAERLRAELEAERQAIAQDRRCFEERGAVLEAAVLRLREAQEKQATDEANLRERMEAFDLRAAEQAEQVALVQGRATQLAELQQRLDAERHALRERATALERGEQTRVILQEQLQRRSEELSARQKALAEQERRLEGAANEYQSRIAAIEERRAAVERERQAAEERMAARVQELDAQRAALDARQEHLDALQRRVQEMGRNVAAARKALNAEQTQCIVEQQAAEQNVEQRRAELAASRQEALALQARWPELEQLGRSAVERLAQARDQLRGSLTELHAFARQGRDDLEELRRQVEAEAERVRRQDGDLHRARDEHRLAVAAFRQQIIDWQGQVAEMRRALAQGEAHLERRQAEVEEQARQVDAVSARLAQQSEELQEQQRQVVERRQEVERHLADMREWYRKKLRELALSRRGEPTSVPLPERIDADLPERDILTLTGDSDPGDRQLGELLRSLELVDADTLGALLVEARRQRRSLRQVLLAGNFLTLYQLALIEAGNLDALVLGPTRVIDRLRATPHEVVYRVFDPRCGREVLLRHLSEADAQDAVRPDEFRQRFTAAANVQHPHVAAVLEVLDIAGRPAVLQEWLTGLPSTDWPALAAVPGVWYRLLCQAALGLHTAHEHGLLHGHLHAGLVLLTADGTVKLTGFGEPPWLIELPEGDEEEAPPPPGEDAAADLAALGRIAAGWANAARRKGAKAKALPESLQKVLERLRPESGPDQLVRAGMLLDALDQAGATVPPNGEAWERLLRHVRDHAPAETLRRSA